MSHFIELTLLLDTVLILIWVEFEGQSPISGVDLVICARFGHVQNCIVIESHIFRVASKLDF